MIYLFAAGGSAPLAAKERPVQKTVVPGIAMWSVWQPDRNLFFNSFFVEHAQGNLVIDPLAAGDDDLREIEARGGVATVVVTNRDHERAARALAEHFGTGLVASALEAPLLAGPVQRALQPGDRVGDGCVVALDGMKTAGEFALHFPERNALVIGDALWGSPAGALRLMPADKLADPARALLSLRTLRALHPQHVLVGDGACIFGDGVRVLEATLAANGAVYPNRINRDEAVWRSWTGEPPRYASVAFEIGDYIGAEKLGYRLVLLEPGRATCPLHWHAAEEELFVMMTGGATLVTSNGEFELRTGDYIAFPTAPGGAHKIENRTAAPCEILMVANVDARDVCYYPDSKKVLVEATELLVRDNPVLDYWDGE